MGTIWWVLPAAIAFLGALLVLNGTRHLLRRHFGRGATHVIGGSAAVVVGVALCLVGLSMQVFARLTRERPIATIMVTAVAPGQDIFNVAIHRLDAQIPDQICTLQGDEWMVSARVQKWKPWVNVIGLDSTYRLDQMDNKYFTAERGNGKLITACDLSDKLDVDGFVPKKVLTWLLSHFYIEQRRFGSANYMPLVDGATYRIVMTQFGLNAEPVNGVAVKANNDRPQ